MANDDASDPPDLPSKAAKAVALPDVDEPVPHVDVDPEHLLPDPVPAVGPEPPLARSLRLADEGIGHGERVLIAALFLGLVCIGFYRTLADLLWNERPLWAIEGIRVGVFAIAMMGAAFATHHKRNFNLDILSRLFGPRGRAILRVILNLAAILGAVLLFYGGWLVKETLAREHEYELVPKWMIGWFIPIAAGLIIVHTVLHTIIEIVYLTNGRTAPEPEQGVA